MEKPFCSASETRNNLPFFGQTVAFAIERPPNNPGQIEEEEIYEDACQSPPPPTSNEEINIPGVFTEENAINILIIGETGVGKSTFINSFANYLRFENLEEVERENPIVLIPCKFTVTDENYELREVRIGSDKNEHTELGKSCTQEPKVYTFPISGGQRFVRLIDTPGIGDNRGIDQDTINCKKIVDFISNYKVMHGIMFLLKPNSTKITVLFEFCMKQILSRLEKSASNNLLFVFTNTRGTDYRPGETLPCLREVLKGISQKPPYVNFPLSKTNIFCCDNEAFRYLAAKANGIQFSEREKQRYSESWEKSAEESWRAIIHIIGDDNHKALEPHKVENTLCVNEARTLISQLKQPMADITQLIQDKLRALQTHSELLDLENLSAQDLKKNLFIPIIDIVVMEMPKPATVCTSSKCAKIYKVRNVTKYHYEKRCHDPCFLKNVREEMIGAPQLTHCAAMKKNRCENCGCDFSTHMHIYYESKTTSITIENDNVKKSLLTKEEIIKEKENIIKGIQLLKDELEEEHKTIIHYIAKFANFLQQNAITPYNDAYRQYIEYLIDREKSLGDAADHKTISYLRKCQKEYDEAKKLFDKVLNSRHGTVDSMNPESVRQSVDALFLLKHTGKKIEELFKSQCRARRAEDKHSNVSNSPQTNKNNKAGLLNKASTKLKNYFWGSSNQNAIAWRDADSDEDNTSYGISYYEFDRNLHRGWQKWEKKNQKKCKKQNKGNRSNYAEHLSEMKEEASAASATLEALTYDINKL